MGEEDGRRMRRGIREEGKEVREKEGEGNNERDGWQNGREQGRGGEDEGDRRERKSSEIRK